jgi:putative redox protein
MHSSSVHWLSGMQFDAELYGHHLMLDYGLDSPAGKDSGPRPKALMLTSLAGCTAFDVVGILERMRVTFSDFCVKADGNLTDEHPKVYKEVHLTYTIRVAERDEDKVKKAVELSKEKYCGVSAMFRAFAVMTYEITFLH